MARRFEDAFGIKADTLLRMQVAYGLAQIEMPEDRVRIERVGRDRLVGEPKLAQGSNRSTGAFSAEEWT